MTRQTNSKRFYARKFVFGSLMKEYNYFPRYAKPASKIDFEKNICKKQLKVWCLLSGSTKLIRCVPDQGVLVHCSTRGKLCCRRWRLTRKPTVTSPPCSLAKSPAHSSSAPSTERSSPGRSLPTESPSSLSSTRLKKSYLR